MRTQVVTAPIARPNTASTGQAFGLAMVACGLALTVAWVGFLGYAVLSLLDFAI